MGEKSMPGDWVSTELETAHQHLEDDPFFGAYDPNFFEKVLKNIEMGDHQMQHALDELSAANKRIDELEESKADLVKQSESQLARIAALEKMVDASMNKHECWNCGTRYARFQTEDQNCPVCEKEPIDYRAKHQEAREHVRALEGLLREFDALWDCSEPMKANEPITFDDPSAFNELCMRIKLALGQ